MPSGSLLFLIFLVKFASIRVLASSVALDLFFSTALRVIIVKDDGRGSKSQSDAQVIASWQPSEPSVVDKS
jgi:hypothetical protein